MFSGKEEKFALIILFLVFAIIIGSHFILSGIDKSSFAEEYQNTSEEGEFVYYEGFASEILETKTGGHLIIETDGPVIFIAKGGFLKDLINEGDGIKATGEVSVYNGKNEIIVDDINDIQYFRIDS